MRLGPDADGPRSQEAASVVATPPGVRKTTARQLLAFSHADGQVGFLSAMNTDASLGHSVVAYRRAEVLR